jgi:hypothetical protein
MGSAGASQCDLARFFLYAVACGFREYGMRLNRGDKDRAKHEEAFTPMASKWKKAAGVVKAQNAAVKAFASVPHGIDGDTFFAPIIPDEVV